MVLSITSWGHLGLVVALAGSLVAMPAVAAVPSANQTAVTQGLAYLTSQQQSDGQIAGFPGINQWALLAYTGAGQTNAALLNYLLTHAPAAGASATEWEKSILALTAAGQNPYNAGGTNYVAGLKALHTGGQIGSASAVNDDVYGVLALTAAGVPASDPVLVDAVKFVLDHQLADGGYSYDAAATTSSVDDTAAALAALHAALDAGVAAPGLATGLTGAQNYLLSKANADGGYYSDPAWGTDSNVSSTATALIALNSAGLGGSVTATNAANYLKGTQQADGSFPYQLPAQAGDTFNTAYAVMALSGSGWPQAVYEGPVPTATPTPSVTPAPSATPVPAGGNGNATPSPSPSVLGASTTAGGSGGGILPGVGTMSNIVMGAVALSLALAGGLWSARRRVSSRS